MNVVGRDDLHDLGRLQSGQRSPRAGHYHLVELHLLAAQRVGSCLHMCGQRSSLGVAEGRHRQHSHQYHAAQTSKERIALV